MLREASFAIGVPVFEISESLQGRISLYCLYRSKWEILFPPMFMVPVKLLVSISEIADASSEIGSFEENASVGAVSKGMFFGSKKLVRIMQWFVSIRAAHSAPSLV